MAVPLTFDQATNLELPALVCDANGVICDLNFWLLNVLRIKNIDNFIGKDLSRLAGIPNDILLQKDKNVPWVLHLSSPFLEKKECKIWIIPLSELTPISFLIIVQPVSVISMGHEVELVSLNNQLDKKISQQHILIQYLEKIRFEMDQFGVLQSLLEIISYDLSYQFANYFVMEPEKAELQLSVSNNLQRQIFSNKIAIYPDDYFWQVESDFAFYKITDANHHLVAFYQKSWPQKIFNITQIRLKDKASNYGIIHLINSALESRTGNEEVLSLLVEHTIKVIEKINFYKISVIDEKTGLFNIRYFQQKSQEIILYHLQNQTGLALIMADIDHFKKFNDSHGHQAGDHVLSEVAKSLKKSCRKHDLVARFGGEEFVILLTNLPISNLNTVAERIRKDVEKLAVIFQEQSLQVTISLGGAILGHHGSELHQLINQADQALYHAKKNGRNCFIIADLPKE